MPPDWYQRKPRKRISPTDKVSRKLTDRQRALIIEHTFAPDYLTDSIRAGPVAVGDKRPPVAFTLDEWEELDGYVAAEANHWYCQTLPVVPWKTGRSAIRNR